MSLINKTWSLLFWSICPPLYGRQPRWRSVTVLHPSPHSRHCSFIVFKIWQDKALQEGLRSDRVSSSLPAPLSLGAFFFSLSNPLSRDLISFSWEFTKAFQQVNHREKALDDFLISWESEESGISWENEKNGVFWGWVFFGGFFFCHFCFCFCFSAAVFSAAEAHFSL